MKKDSLISRISIVIIACFFSLATQALFDLNQFNTLEEILITCFWFLFWCIIVTLDLIGYMHSIKKTAKTKKHNCSILIYYSYGNNRIGDHFIVEYKGKNIEWSIKDAAELVKSIMSNHIKSLEDYSNFISDTFSIKFQPMYSAENIKLQGGVHYYRGLTEDEQKEFWEIFFKEKENF